MKHLILVLGLLLLTINLRAQHVILNGSAPQWAGDTLTVYTYVEHLLKSPVALKDFVVEDDGTFECRFEVEGIRPVYIPFGKLQGRLIVEPGHSYELIMPQKIEKTEADLLNPFFKPEGFYLVIKGMDKNDLNNNIRLMDILYTEFVDSNYVHIYTGTNKQKMDSSLRVLEEKLDVIEHPYFRTYKTYRIALLRYYFLGLSERHVREQYFSTAPICPHNPAYMELFNIMFENYLLKFAKTTDGRLIVKDIEEYKSFRALKNTLGNNHILSNDSLKELVILRSLYDAFYAEVYSPEAIMEIMDSMAVHSNIAHHRKIASLMNQKFKQVLPGFPATPFELTDARGNPVSLRSFRGRFVYLQFASMKSHPCLEQFEMLKSLHERHKDYYDIVTISVDEDFNALTELAKTQGYKWTFLHYAKQPDIIDQYKVHSYPTYYLISPEGKIVLGSTPTPAENFEQIFHGVWKNWQIKKAREEEGTGKENILNKGQ